MKRQLAEMWSRRRNLATSEVRAVFILFLGATPYWLEALFHIRVGLANLVQILFWAVLPLLSLAFFVALLVSDKLTGLVLRIRSARLKRWQIAVVGIMLLSGAAYLYSVVMDDFGQARNLYMILLFWMCFVGCLAVVQARQTLTNVTLLMVGVGSILVMTQVVQVSSLIVQVTDLQKTTPGGYADRYDYGLANPDFYPFLIFDAQPALPIPSLTVLADTASTDTQVVQNVVGYYNSHADELHDLFKENNQDRLKALYVMYLIHNLHAYGSDTILAQTLIEFIHDEATVECTLQARFQSRLMDGFGLVWRNVGLGPLHAWLEVWIGDHWEIFDATGNVWVDQGYDQLLRGQSRQYRFFYSPWLDESKPDARVYAQEQQDEGYFSMVPFSRDFQVYYGGVGIQRALTPGIGIYYPPPLYCKLPDTNCEFSIKDASNWTQHPQS